MPRVTMPQLGETVADGTVTKWFKSVGDTVKRGETLFEVSTDKVDTEIPAPADGVLTKILVAEGETVDVGTLLAVIGDDDVDTSTANASVATTASPASSTSAPPARAKVAASSEVAGHVSPVVRRLLAEHQLDANDVPGTGPQGRLTRDDVLAFVKNNVAAPTSSSSAALSPVVRKLLRENDLDASSVRGTGPDGRVTRRDVETLIAQGASSSTSTGDEVIPFTKIRRLTAEHMIRSKSTSAHTLMVKEVDYENVEVVRRSHGAAFKEREGFSLTYLPFNALAALAALRDFPHLNGSVGDDELIVHRDLNLGIAVDLDGSGLVVPVVRNADGYDLRSIARKIRELAEGARTKKLTVDDMAHGTFTITNPGPFGTLMTGAIINQPQVAILATDGVVRKPVVVTDAARSEAIAIHSVGNLALTFDHRVIDGAYAARFLARMAEILQTRDWASEL
ncbi:MAG TPA: 2-oxo acid dehydrogenase subunit E2 [Acidimicrobiales bacterium]|nr:2-oxo acid dehydrogenase subunit E2 [Acidimicrobiales bacterium]